MADKKKVLVDVERLKYPNCGLGQFCLHLGRELLRQARPDWNPIFLIPEDKIEIYGQSIEYEKLSWTKKFFGGGKEYDLWHMTHQDSDYSPPSGVPYILTIHDLNFLTEKSEGKAASRLKKLQKKVDAAAAITVISKFTEKMVRENLTIPDIPVRVIYNGLCIDKEVEPVKPGFAPSGAFLFTLGVIKEKKNFHVLVDFVQGLSNMNLVIAGNKNDAYATRIQKLAQDRGIEDRIIMPGEVEGGVKNWLFQNCKAFVFPSLLEGFGLPLVEAMHFGKPIFCSTATSLPEIGGRDVYYWQSFEPEEMLNLYHRSMRYQLQDGGRHNRLRSRARLFSWENAVGAYIQLYEELLAKR